LKQIGPRKLLARDGGGIRGIISIEILARAVRIGTSFLIVMKRVRQAQHQSLNIIAEFKTAVEERFPTSSAWRLIREKANPLRKNAAT
jgi:hypothetical protein